MLIARYYCSQSKLVCLIRRMNRSSCLVFVQLVLSYTRFMQVQRAGRIISFPQRNHHSQAKFAGSLQREVCLSKQFAKKYFY